MRNTLQYILKKLLFMIPMVLFITFLIYLGLYLTPGDAISYMFSPDQLANIDPAKLEELRELYGLNDPFFVQYFKWLWQLLCGNFGYSLTNGQPISSLLKQYFPATLELSLAALIISSVLGSILGILSALKKGSIGDNVLTVAGMIGVSIPQFFFGMVCVLVFAIHLGVLPIAGHHILYWTAEVPCHACLCVGYLPDGWRYALRPFQYAGHDEQGLHPHCTGKGAA